eukprot:5095585-Prymnesium_polylepis.1
MLRNELRCLLSEHVAASLVRQFLLTSALVVIVQCLVGLEHLEDKILFFQRIRPRQLDNVSHALDADHVRHLLFHLRNDASLVAQIHTCAVERFANEPRGVDLVEPRPNGEVGSSKRDRCGRGRRCCGHTRSGGGTTCARSWHFLVIGIRIEIVWRR